MNEYLVFVKLLGREEDGKYRYEFFFSNEKTCPFNDDEDVDSICGLSNDFEINLNNIKNIYVVKTTIEFDLIQNNRCFSFKQAMDGVVSLCFENIDGYDSYPEDGRLIFMFGETYDEVERKLAIKNILMS